MPYDPALVFTQEISVQEGKKLGHQLSTRPEITGIFASADILAAGIMSGLHECGVSVPRDKSIVGFDDHYISQLAIPGLTTIHQGFGEERHFGDGDDFGAAAEGRDCAEEGYFAGAPCGKGQREEYQGIRKKRINTHIPSLSIP